MAHFFEKGLDDDLVGHRIFGHQNVEYVRMPDSLVVSGLGGLLTHLQGQVKVKHRAIALAAGHTDLPAHQLHQLFANGKPQAGAAIAAGGGAVGLLKLLEHALLRSLRHADAAVTHHKVRPLHIPRGCGQALRCFLQRLHMDGDATLFSELERVTDEVDQHLADASRVAIDVGRDAGVHVDRKLDRTLTRALIEHDQRFAQHGAQGKVDVFQGELAGLDFGDIKQVVHDGEQAAGVGLRHGQLLAQRDRHGLAQAELQHADNAGHGGAQLVAHECHKLRFGLVGRLGFVALCGQHLLVLLKAIEVGFQAALEQTVEGLVEVVEVRLRVFAQARALVLFATVEVVDDVAELLEVTALVSGLFQVKVNGASRSCQKNQNNYCQLRAQRRPAIAGAIHPQGERAQREVQQPQQQSSPGAPALRQRAPLGNAAEHTRNETHAFTRCCRSDGGTSH